MITIGMNYQVLPGKEPAFEQVFAAVLKLMDQMAGHHRTRLYRDVTDQARYLIVSDWSDRAAFDRFIASPQFRSVADWGRQRILAERPSHDYYETSRPVHDGDTTAMASGGCPVHHSPTETTRSGDRA